MSAWQGPIINNAETEEELQRMLYAEETLFICPECFITARVNRDVELRAVASYSIECKRCGSETTIYDEGEITLYDSSPYAKIQEVQSMLSNVMSDEEIEEANRILNEVTQQLTSEGMWDIDEADDDGVTESQQTAFEQFKKQLTGN